MEDEKKHIKGNFNTSCVLRGIFRPAASCRQPRCQRCFRDKEEDNAQGSCDRQDHGQTEMEQGQESRQGVCCLQRRQGYQTPEHQEDILRGQGTQARLQAQIPDKDLHQEEGDKVV